MEKSTVSPKKSENEEIIDRDWEALILGGHLSIAKETALREGKGMSVFLMKDVLEEGKPNCRFMYYGAGGEGWKRTLQMFPDWADIHLKKYDCLKHLLIGVIRSTPTGCFGIFHICDGENLSIIV